MGMTGLSKRKKVAIFLPSVSDYRISFLNCLRRDLKQNNIDLQLFYGTKVAANITGAQPKFGTYAVPCQQVWSVHWDGDVMWREKN
jgi:hypothetical protein